MHNKTREKLIRVQAKEWLDGYGIPWDQYDAGVLKHEYHSWRNHAQMVFTHKESGRQIVFGSMWVNEDTGEIMQAGSNYGNLTY